MSPTATPTAAMGPVYGLVSGRIRPNESPSHAHAQWLTDPFSLTYRCGGSAGITPSVTPASRLIRDDSIAANTSKLAQCAEVRETRQSKSQLETRRAVDSGALASCDALRRVGLPQRGLQVLAGVGVFVRRNVVGSAGGDDTSTAVAAFRP